ncbi:hypothetical protein GXW84_40535 [Rhodococcus sp. IEGM 248]|nr:hypothetical protein [Rhodococcus sp. IEGM 248]RZL75621.1 MAG: hypothetical protein EOP32_31015 [Rhodococcus sp. (in: high G+C Gram-positive bacteria)]
MTAAHRGQGLGIVKSRDFHQIEVEDDIEPPRKAAGRYHRRYVAYPLLDDLATKTEWTAVQLTRTRDNVCG